MRCLLDATRIRLRSDVPVGAYLSGGLDSSIVVGRHASGMVPERLRTFSVTFEVDGIRRERVPARDGAALGTRALVGRAARTPTSRSTFPT